MRTTSTTSRPHAAARLAPPRLTPLASAVAGAWLLAGPLALQAQVLPTGPQVAAGQASISTQGAQMTVRNTPGAIVNWQSFSIGAANRVVFEQANAASKVLNRVVGNDASLILGSLSSNGQVWLLNPNGVLFGHGARVDVAALVASTLRLNDNDFLAGRYRFTALDGDRAGVRNEGTLSSSFGGQIVLLGSDVHNAGDISAPGGSVSLAATSAVDLVDTGLPNLAVRVQVPAGETVNLGRLMAAGGLVDVYGAIVNQQGVVAADGFGQDAQGRVVLKASQALNVAAGSRTSADGAAGGSVTLDAGGGTTMVEGVVSATGAAGAGGRIDVLGQQVGLVGSAVVDVSGQAGGGRVRIGGGAEGKDTSVVNARAVYMGENATVRADALAQGDGGNIVLWADEAMRAYGRFSARGGAAGGSGGFVETSGGWLDARPAALDLTATAGVPGRWLLDPNDITITNQGPDQNVTPGPNFTSTNDNSVISTATIAAVLNAGNSVTIATGTGGSNAQAGDISMTGAALNVVPAFSATLELQASRDIVVRDSTISSTGRELNVFLRSNGAGFGAVELNNATINTAGGALDIGGSTSRTLLLPDGSQTTALYSATRGYDPQQQPLASKLVSPRVGINIQGSRLNVGAFFAVGQSDAGPGIVVGGGTQVQARNISFTGFSSVRTGVVPGISVEGNTTDMAASVSLSLNGFGSYGALISQGARLKLDAPANPFARMTLLGYGVERGVAIWDASLSTTATFRGTPITVIGGEMVAEGRTTGATNVPGLQVTGNFGAGIPLAPTLDLAAASAARLSDVSATVLAGNLPLQLTQVRIAGPANGSFGISSQNGTAFASQVAYVGSGSLSWSGSAIRLGASSIVAAATPLALDFATQGPQQQGVQVTNSNIVTGGGNVRFGTPQQVCSVALGCTSVSDLPWVVSNTSTPAAGLFVSNTAIDAGAGRITGGGAVSGNASAGTALSDSRLSARDIVLSGRSDTQTGVQVTGGAVSATHSLALDAVSGATTSALFVSAGTTLQLLDTAPDASSVLSLTGSAIGTGAGINLQAGDAGSALETVITVDSGRLNLLGTSTAGIGLYALGTDARPGGLIINTLGATTVALEGRNTTNSNDGLLLFNMNILGPQAAAGHRMDFVGAGQLADGTPGTRFSRTAITSGAPVGLLANGLSFGNTRIVADEGIALRSDAQAATAPISMFNTTLAASAPGAEIRIESNDGSAVKGRSVFNTGQGINITDSLLRSSGANGLIHVTGQGAPDGAGGYGTVLAGAALQADRVELIGQGATNGDGVFLRSSGFTGTQTTVNTRDLTITGYAANTLSANTTAQLYLGVEVADQTVITMRDRGDVVFTGDTVSLQGTGATQRVRLGGDARSVLVSSTGSQQLRYTDVDFTTGAGTSIRLLSDSDADLKGRVRLDNVSVLTGGGNVTVTGGSGAAAGIYSLDANNLPQPFNSSVREGANGILFNGAVTVDTGSGDLLLQGRGATDGRSVVSNNAGTFGIGFFSTLQGDTVLSGRNVRIEGDAGDKGIGVSVNAANNSRLDIVTTGTLSVLGRGVGTEPNSGSPLPGVAMAGPGQWRAGGALSVTSLANGLVFGPGAGLDAASVTLTSTGRLRLEGSTVSGAGGVSLLTTGPNTSAPEAGGIYVSAGALVRTQDTGAAIRLGSVTGGAAIGDAGRDAGTGVVVDFATLRAPGGSVQINGQGAPAGGMGVSLRGATLFGDVVSIQGQGVVDADGLRLEQSNNLATNIGARNLTISGTAAHASDARTKVGVAMVDFTTLVMQDRGALRISGDYVLMDGTNNGRIDIRGNAATATIESQASMLLRRVDLNFADGAGTTVTLRSDSDASGAGRVRMIDSTVVTAGGDFTITGGNGAAAGVLVSPTLGNTTVIEGSSGLSVTGLAVNAGSGTVRWSARGLADVTSAAPQGFSGILASGANAVTAGAIEIDGTGGNTGRGVDVGSTNANATLNLNAGRIAVVTTGLGFDTATGLPLPALTLKSPSTWSAGSGSLTVTSQVNGLEFDGATLRGGNVSLLAAERLALAGTTVRASGALQMQGSARGNGRNAVLLGDALDLQGASVDIAGISDGETPIRGIATSGRIAATEGVLHLNGRNVAQNTEGVWLEGDFALSAAQKIFIESDNGLRLWQASPTATGPTLSSPVGVEIALKSTVGSDFGGADASVNAADLARALAGQGATTTTTLRGESPGLAFSAPLALNSRLVVQADAVILAAGASLSSTAGGDAVVMGGALAPTIANFDNQAGPNVLSAPNGRWVLRLNDPRTSVLGGLESAFTSYNLAAQPWAQGPDGNYVTPASGNALGFAISTTQLNPNTAALGGVLARTYDTTTTVTLDPATWTINGLLAGDTLTLSGSTIALLQDKNVGTAKPVTLDNASVFSVTDARGKPVFGYDRPVFTANITPATLVASGTAVAGKVYDANTTATLSSLGSVTPLAGDQVALGGNVVAAFADKNVGTAKPVTVSGLALTGADAANYTLVVPTTTYAADITPAPLVVTGLAAAGKVYDATSAAALTGSATIAPLAADQLLLQGTGSASFADKNVGTDKAVTVTGYTLAGADAGNYTLQQPAGLRASITPATLAVAGLSAVDKVYDATPTATLAGAATVLPLGSDAVVLSGTARGSFADKNAGIAKPVTVSGLSLTGPDAGNYNLDVPAALTAAVTPAALVVTGTAVAGKVYDANTTATLSSLGSVTPLAGDQVALGGNVVAAFADKNVGTAKPVTVNGLALTGADAANYTLVVPAAAYTASITPASLAVTGLAAAGKVYDATSAAPLTGSAAIAPLGADQVLLQGTASASFADKNVGTDKPVTVAGYTLAGADAGNYTLQLPAGLRASITPATLAVTGLSAVDKTYDGTTTATLAGTAGVQPLGNDVVQLSGSARGSYADKNVAITKAVTVSGLALSGPDAANYTLQAPPLLAAAITPAALTLQGLAAADKTYDGTLAASLSARLGGVVAGDTVGLNISGQFADRNAGAARIVNYQASTTGADAANYTLAARTGFTTASILPATLVYTATPAGGLQGNALPLLTGSVLGFVPGDTLASATTGQLAWTTDATSASPAGSYAIVGSGLAAPNYRFTQAAGNATALTMRTQPTSTADPVTTVTTQVISTAVFSVTLPVTMSSPTQGRVLDVVQAFAFSGESLAPVSAATTAGAPTAGGGTTAPATGGTARPLASTGGEATTTAASTAAAGGATTAAAGGGSTTAASGGGTPASGNGGSAPVPSGGSTPAAGNGGSTVTAGDSPAPAAAGGSTTVAAGNGGNAPTATNGGNTPAASGGSTTVAAGGSTSPSSASGSTAPASGNGAPAPVAAAGGSPAPATSPSEGGISTGGSTATASTAGSPADPQSTTTSPAPAAAGSVAAAATAGVVVIPGFGTAAGGAEGFGGGDGLTFRSVNFSLLRRDEIQALLAARASYKRKVFAGSIGKLTTDPTLADVPACTSEAQAAAGTCIVTEALKREIEAVAARAARPGKAGKRKVKVATLPNIERKLALLIGVNKYVDRRVPELLSAVPDAQAVQTLLEARMGYETTVLENPTRETIIRAFNKLALEADSNDSVIVYYAGHGVVVPVNGVDTGYWLPGDTNAEEPSTWLANADIARMVAAIGSRQMMLISDSCYSGSLAGNERVQVDGRAGAADLLSRKAVVVMSSGGDEPVADEGRDGHSVFAWHLMDKLQTLDAWQVGGSIFERVRAAVSKEFPQTPQYGASRSAGHQGNTDYLFERRELEKPAP